MYVSKDSMGWMKKFWEGLKLKLACCCLVTGPEARRCLLLLAPCHRRWARGSSRNPAACAPNRLAPLLPPCHRRTQHIQSSFFRRKKPSRRHLFVCLDITAHLDSIAKSPFTNQSPVSPSRLPRLSRTRRTTNGFQEVLRGRQLEMRKFPQGPGTIVFLDLNSALRRSFGLALMASASAPPWAERHRRGREEDRHRPQRSRGAH